MPAKSKAQQRLMGIALGIKRGEVSPEYSPEAAGLARTMSEPDLKEFAATPAEKLPPKIKPVMMRRPKKTRPRRQGLAEIARKEQAKMKNPGQPPLAPRNRLAKVGVKK